LPDDAPAAAAVLAALKSPVTPTTKSNFFLVRAWAGWGVAAATRREAAVRPRPMGDRGVAVGRLGTGAGKVDMDRIYPDRERSWDRLGKHRCAFDSTAPHAAIRSSGLFLRASFPHGPAQFGRQRSIRILADARKPRYEQEIPLEIADLQVEGDLAVIVLDVRKG